MPRTRTIVIDQEALEPWAGKIDLVDGALIHFVTIRLTRRAKQHIISPAGIPLVWIHYPTVRAENWLLHIDDRSLQRRFQKLVRLELLVRRQVSLGRERGSRTYFGISEQLKERFEVVDEGRKKARLEAPKLTGPKGPQEAGQESTGLSTAPIDPSKMTGAYEPPNLSGAYEPPKMAGQSLGMSLGMSLRPTGPSYPQSPPQREASKASLAAEERAKKLQARRKLLAEQAQMLFESEEAQRE